MRLWAGYSLAIVLALSILFAQTYDAAVAGGKAQPSTGQGRVIFTASPDGKGRGQTGRRVTAPATGLGTVIYRKPNEDCPRGSELYGKECVPKCPSGMVRFGANCVSDGSGPSTVTPSTDPRPDPAPEPDPPADLARPLQEELKRLGCLTGRVDGIWGRQSRAALRKFARKTGLSINRREPTHRALREARDRPDGYCVPVQASCPGDTFREGGRCVCGSGKVRRGDKCVTKPPSCPGDTYLEGGRCVCDPGYVRRGSSCVKSQQPCPGDTYREGGKCVCDAGLIRRGSRCIKPPRSCPGDTYRKNGKCVCDRGKIRIGNKCIRPQLPCPGDTYREGGRCVCDKGKVRRGSRCVSKRPQCGPNQYRCNGDCCNKSQTESEPGNRGGGNRGPSRRQIKKCQQKCGARLIGCMLKYNNQRKCQGQLATCKARYGC